MVVPRGEKQTRNSDTDALVRTLAETLSHFHDNARRIPSSRGAQQFAMLAAEYDQAMVQLRDRFGEQLLLEALLTNPTAYRQLPFPITVDSVRLESHFSSTERQNFDELLRVCTVFKAPDFALKTIKNCAHTWPTPGHHYNAIFELVAYLANAYAQQPLVFADVLHAGATLLDRIPCELRDVGLKPEEFRHRDDDHYRALRESQNLTISTLSYLLRRPWQGEGSKPVRTLCEFLDGVARTRGHEEIFRNSIEPSVSIADRRQMAEYLASSGNTMSDVPVLQAFFRKSLSLSDSDFEFVSKYCRIVCSGSLDPRVARCRSLINRGITQLSLVGQLSSADGSEIVSRLKEHADELRAIPKKFLLIAAGLIDADWDKLGEFNDVRSQILRGLRSFDRICYLIKRCDKETQARAWENLRQGLLGFQDYGAGRLMKILQAGGINTPDDAVVFTQYLRKSAKLSTIATRHGLPPLEITSDWNKNLSSLKDIAHEFWCTAIADAFPANSATCTGYSSDDLAKMPSFSVPRETRQQNIAASSHLLPFFEYAYIHWEEGATDHYAETQKLIEALGAPPYSQFKIFRYDENRPNVAEQLRSLTSLQREAWCDDYFGKPVKVSSGTATTTLRMLVTDFPEVLLKIGETPHGTASCLSLAGNPSFNQAVLATIGDAHQKAALFLNIAHLPVELRSASKVTLDMLFRYSEDIRAACVCRSILKVAEKLNGSAVLVQAPEYFSAKQSDRSVTTEFRREVASYAVAHLGVPIYGGRTDGEDGEVISIPPSSSNAGQNDDYDGVRWSSRMRGRYSLTLQERSNS